MFQCDICSKEYKYKRNLTRHINEKHSNLDYYLCPTCNAHFIRRSYIIRHAVTIHQLAENEARVLAIQAVKESEQGDNNGVDYDQVSSDEDILDLLEDVPHTDNVTEKNYTDEFNLDLLDENNNGKEPEPVCYSSHDDNTGEDALLSEIGDSVHGDDSDSEYVTLSSGNNELSDSYSEVSDTENEMTHECNVIDWTDKSIKRKTEVYIVSVIRKIAVKDGGIIHSCSTVEQEYFEFDK